jgi:hypothetical protein
MKVCPECGTQYEDHVPTCIADGADLVPHVVQQPAAPAPAAADPTIKLPISAPRAPPPPPPEPQSRFSIALLLIAVLGAGVVVTVVGLIAVTWGVGGNRTVEPLEAAHTVPAPRPLPESEPNERPPVEVVLVSEPLGAKVYENEQFVCETPCAVQHPPHAPLPRSFVFKAEGYRDRTFEMTEARGPITVELSRLRSSTGPNGSSSPIPRPTIGRDR